MAAGAAYIDHIVIASNDSAATARLFSEQLGITIKRTMSRPGTGAHLEFAKLREVIVEFAGPGDVKPYEEPKARLAGFVLAVEDIHAAIAAVRAAGFEAEEPHRAVQPGAAIAAVTSGTHGVPFAFIQYNYQPTREEEQQ